jgi:DNA-binding protein H-NS
MLRSQTRFMLEAGARGRAFQAGGLDGSGRAKAARANRGPVAPKYRNPTNPSETWSGPGLKPRWMTAAMKSGEKPEDFLVAGGPKVRTRKNREALEPRS